MTKEPPMDIMVDFETLGSGTRPYLMSVAVVLFDPNVIDDPTASFDLNRKFVRYFNYRAQPNRRVEIQSLLWWLSRGGGGGGEALMRQLNPPRSEQIIFSPYSFCVALNHFIRNSNFDQGCCSIWARGTDFDIRILQELYDDTSNSLEGTPVMPFWNQSNIQDVRTLLKSARLSKSLNPNPHDPLQDCLFQIYDVQQALSILANQRKSTMP